MKVELRITNKAAQQAAPGKPLSVSVTMSTTDPQKPASFQFSCEADEEDNFPVGAIVTVDVPEKKKAVKA